MKGKFESCWFYSFFVILSILIVNKTIGKKKKNERVKKVKNQLLSDDVNCSDNKRIQIGLFTFSPLNY